MDFHSVMEDFLLSNKERIQIFKTLCEHKHLNFNSIVNITKIPSNKLSYHLKLMKQHNFVLNNERGYSLSLEAERLIPYFSQIFKKEPGVLPVILGIIRNGSNILLLKRKKMPYKDHWGLIGGKQISGETIPQTIEREVFEEAHINAKFERYNGIVYERLKDGDQFKHSFLFIITTLNAESTNATTQDEGEVKWFDLRSVMNNKIPQVIPSDIEFLKKYVNNKMEIEHIVMEENNEKLNITEEYCPSS